MKCMCAFRTTWWTVDQRLGRGVGGGGGGGEGGGKWRQTWVLEKEEEALSHCDFVDHVSLVEQVALTMKASTMHLKPTSLG